ncbi:MAG: hypothetical protein U1F27_12565 [Turneriella sp.]
MTNRKRNLIIAAIAIPAVICGGWYWQSRGKAHAHKAEKLSGETSFDVYADGQRLHMLVLKEHGQHQSIVYRGFAGGEVSPEIALPINPREKIISRRSNDVQIAAAGNHLLAAWQISGTGYANRGPIRTAESRDGGQTWQQATPPTAANRTDDQGFFDIETDDRGRFHIVWLDSQAKIKGLRHAMFAGQQWSAAQTIDAETCQCCWNSLRKNPQGELLVLYRNARPRDMALARYDGKAWHKAGIVDGFNWQVEMCPHAGGGLAIDNEQTFAVTWTGREDSVGCYLSKRGKPDSLARPQKFGNNSARNPDIAQNAHGLAIVWDEFEGASRRAKFTLLPKTDRKKMPDGEILSDTAKAGAYARVLNAGDGFYAFWSETLNANSTIRWRKL